MALAILVSLCLLTYNSNDPASSTESSSKIQNWVGIVGAIIAKELFSALGWVAYILPLLFLLIAYRSFHALKISLGRVIGFLVLLASASGFIALFQKDGFVSNSLGLVRDNFGGYVGYSFALPFVKFLGILGTGILFAALFLSALLFVTSFSFASFFGNFRLAWENFRVHFDEWREKRRKRRDANQAFDNLEKKHEPRAELPKVIKAGIEESVPTVWAAEEIVQEVEKPIEIVNAGEEIPIEPVYKTDELEPELLPETEEKIEREKAAQNFDKYVLPASDLLKSPPPRVLVKEDEARALAKILEEKTGEFSVNGHVVNICPGPVVTTYEFKPDPGVKYSRVTGLSDDLCLALKAESIRIDRIPGKAFVGIEVPNRERETIHIREVIESKKFKSSSSLLSIALGKSIDGLNYVTDLAMMPHLLIAGSTGAGKSVGINSLVVSILYKAKPDEVKFIMIDPKRLELGLYAEIPHLATPIITDTKRAAISLKWAVSEMERRYKELAGWGVRSIDGYNTEARRRNANEHFDDNGEPWRVLPYIVIIIDELADLMMASGKEVEEAITRLAQMARAVGIHLVLATQRPSVDVITGLIKANFPARISFRVSTKVDSRTIIDANGAEQLLGKGDMLFLPPATSQIIRIHGAFVDEKEINRIVKHVKSQGNPEYDTTITKSDEELADSDDLPGKKDALYLDALRTVVSSKRASTSLLQRHLRIGYGRAAAILDAMVHDGYIGDMDGSTRARAILQKAYDDLQEAEEGREI